MSGYQNIYEKMTARVNTILSPFVGRLEEEYLLELKRLESSHAQQTLEDGIEGFENDVEAIVIKITNAREPIKNGEEHSELVSYSYFAPKMEKDVEGDVVEAFDGLKKIARELITNAKNKKKKIGNSDDLNGHIDCDGVNIIAVKLIEDIDGSTKNFKHLFYEKLQR